MDNLKGFLENAAVPLFLAIFGGVTRSIRYGVSSWKQFAVNIVVAGFTGILVHLFLQDAAMSETVKAAACGLSGYAGAIILDGAVVLLQKVIEHRVKPGGE